MLLSENTDMSEAVRLAQSADGEESIGVLGEKTLHSALKYYFCMDRSHHEIKFKGYVADILIERENEKPLIMEIQTRQTFRLARKLNAYADSAAVIVVLPMLAEKQLIWVEKDTGELIKGGKTTRPKNIYHALKEIYSIRDCIKSDNVSIYIPFIKGTEYRKLDGYGENKKRGSTRLDIVPEKIIGITKLETRDDYARLVPFAEGEQFGTKEFAKAAKISAADSRYAMLTLNAVGVISECGRDGRRKLWTLAKQ